ncbi:MAG: ABC transporter ATP-binding protein [Oscillospiraceae bacterium]|nr:ABC transporter ATP-binding protein [Oscillospiraceae bacterium]
MENAIKVEHVSKEYRLGAIGGGTLKGDLQSWWAKVRHREDPNLRIDQAAGAHRKNERFLALNDVSFSAKPGEAIGIIGHNGAGKSTLLKLISRVTAPSAGTISYNGRIASMLEVGTGFHPEMTGRENIYMNGAILGMTKAEISRKFDEIVEFAEMRQFIDTPVKRYSSGMYVKLAFAVAAHLDSEIMIMDEVLAVGDAKFQQKCLGKMGDAANSQGRTVLYVSHNMSTIRELCSRCIVLSHGQKVFDGGVEDAIAIYLGLAEQFKPVRQFDSQKRKGYFGDYLRIDEVEFLDTQDGKILNELAFRVKFHCGKDVENVCARAEINAPENYTIGTAPSGVLIEHLKAGGQYSCVLRMQVPDLMPGKFNVTLLFYSENKFKNTTTLDRVENAVIFEVSEAKIVRWVTRDRGYIKLPDLEISDFRKDGV